MISLGLSLTALAVRGRPGGGGVTLTGYTFDTAPDPDTFSFTSSHLGTAYGGFWPTGTAPATGAAIKAGTGASDTVTPFAVSEGTSPPIALSLDVPDGSYDFALVVQATSGGGFSNIVGHPFTVSGGTWSVTGGAGQLTVASAPTTSTPTVSGGAGQLSITG